MGRGSILKKNKDNITYHVRNIILTINLNFNGYDFISPNCILIVFIFYKKSKPLILKLIVWAYIS